MSTETSSILGFEVQQGVSISEGHATASKGMLDVILDFLTP